MKVTQRTVTVAELTEGYFNDEEEGVYTVINFTSEPSFPAELDRVYKITEGVMRSLIVAHEE